MTLKLKQKLVISAINLTEGGPLSVLDDCIAEAVPLLKEEWELIILVNKKSLLKTDDVTVIEFPLSKKSWLFRIYYEWWYFQWLSRKIKPDVWLSLHDMTPWVKANRQAVYCHNPAPFYRMSLSEVFLEPKLLLFNLFYEYLYKVGIQRNNYIIVQQQWLRQEFKKLFSVSNVVVAHPVVSVEKKINKNPSINNKIIFFYPALARVFKNIELICEAVKLLNQQGILNFEVRLTLHGKENRYAAMLFKRYGNIRGVNFIGRQTREEMNNQYTQSDCVLFPSLLETWGLPISEAKAFNKPLLVSELPYAHETVGEYDKVNFINPHDNREWANKMKSIITGAPAFKSVSMTTPEAPYAQNWRELLLLLTSS